MGVSIFNTGYDLQDQIDAAESAIAIVSIGDTHAAITSGQYVYVREHGTLAEGLYRATANIAANGTLSGSNVTAVSGGGLNALNSKIVTNSIDINNAEIYNSDYVESARGRLSKIGDLVIMNVIFIVKADVTLTTSTTLLSIPSAYRPSSNIDCNGVFGNEAIYGQVKPTGSVIQNNWPSKSVVSDTIMELNANWKV